MLVKLYNLEIIQQIPRNLPWNPTFQRPRPRLQDAKLTLQDDMTVLIGRMEHETSLGIEGATVLGWQLTLGRWWVVMKQYY